MTKKSLSLALKIIMIGLALCGFLIYGYVLPLAGQYIIQLYPEFSSCYIPWMVLLLMTAVPCYAVLFFLWKIAKSIGEDKAFTMENSRSFRMISRLALGDGLFFFLANVIFLFFHMSHPSLVLLALGILFVGAAIAVAGSGLSLLTAKAAALQEQSDWTI